MEALSEVESLRYQVAEFRAALGLTQQFPRKFRLTPHEAKVLGILVKREIASRDFIYRTMYADEWMKDREPKIIEVYLSNMRKKLRPFDITIQNDYGHGWFLSAGDKARIAKLREEQEECQ